MTKSLPPYLRLSRADPGATGSDQRVVSWHLLPRAGRRPFAGVASHAWAGRAGSARDRRVIQLRPPNDATLTPTHGRPHLGKLLIAHCLVTRPTW